MTSPEKHHVHHSYVWMGSIRIAAIILFASMASIGSSFVGVLMEGNASTPQDARTILIIFAICILAVILVVAVVVIYQIISYKHLYYELSPSEFNLYKGILSKKRIHVPYQRVQSVDQRASFFQRIFGICTVSIDTAGGSSNKAITVPYLTKQAAETLRTELFTRKIQSAGQLGGSPLNATLSGHVAATAHANILTTNTPTVPDASVKPSQTGNVLDTPAEVWNQFDGVFGSDPAFAAHADILGMGKVSFEYGLSNKELVLTGLSNNTTFALMLVGVLGIIAQVFDAVVDLVPETGSMISQMVTSGTTWAIGAVVATGVAMLFGVVVFIWGLSAAAACISYGGFHARRRGNRIEVERGLLQHQFQGVDIDRVQSITIRQSFVRRLLGYCEITLGKVEAASNNGEESQRNSLTHGLVIHPFIKVDKVADILAGIIPEYADVPYESHPLPRVALRRGIVRRCILQGFGFWLGILVAISHIAFSAGAYWAGDAELVAAMPIINTCAIVGYVLAVLFLAIDVISTLLWHRESSFAFNRKFMQITAGGLSRETTSFLRSKIQFGYLRVNPLQKRAHTATINVRTAAGVGGTTVRLIDAREEDAFAWLEWLRPRGKQA